MKQPEQNRGASPVEHTANGNVGDRGVMNDDKSNTVTGKDDQEQHADRSLQAHGNDEEDNFDLQSLKGHTDGGGEKPAADHDLPAS